MRTLRRPSDGQLIEYLLRAADLPLNRAANPVSARPVGHSVSLGEGLEDYDRAVAHLLTWAMVPRDMVELYWAQRPVLPGTTVAVGLWARRFFWVNPCRITEVSIDRAGGLRLAGGAFPSHTPSRAPTTRNTGEIHSPFGAGGDRDRNDDRPSGEDATARVAWRTVEGHALVGEQSFTVRYHGDTGRVEYEIAGVAQPVPWLRMHWRSIQSMRQQFAERSCEAMRVAMHEPARRPSAPLLHSLARGI